MFVSYTFRVDYSQQQGKCNHNSKLVTRNPKLATPIPWVSSRFYTPLSS